MALSIFLTNYPCLLIHPELGNDISGVTSSLFEFFEGFISISADAAQGDFGLFPHLLDVLEAVCGVHR